MKLKDFAIRGFFWTSLSSTIVQAVQFITKIVLARLLLPEDFGLVAIALVIVNAFALVNDFGGSTAIIYFKRKKEEVINTSFFITLVIGIFFFLITLIFSGIVADFFSEPVISGILKIFSIVFLFAAPSSVATAILTKELKFNRLIYAETGSIIVYAFVTIFMALKGFGVWSLVFGYLFSVIASVTILLLVTDWRPRLRFDMKVGKKLIDYGKYVIGANIVGFLLTQGDNAVIGKVISSTALGFYVMAYSLANLPSRQIAGVISKVMFPTFSKLQNNYKRLKNAYMRTIEILLFLTIPFVLGTTSIINEFVIYVLGDRWTPIIYPICILLWFGLFRSIFNLGGTVYQSIGKPEIHTKVIIFNLIIFLILIFPLTIRYGIIGTSVAVSVAMFLSSVATMIILRKILRIYILDIIKKALPTIVSSLIMFLSILGIKYYIYPLDSVMGVILAMVFGAGSYALLSALLNKERLDDAREILSVIFK